MKINAVKLLVLVVVLIGVGLCTRGQNGPPGNFVVLNDWKQFGDNTGSVFSLSSVSHPTLTRTETLHTRGISGGAPTNMPEAVTLQHGSSVCIYISDPATADIAAFLYPSITRVGSYQLPKIRYSGGSLGLAARGSFLFATYLDKDNGNYIATWKIGNGCALSLAKSNPVYGFIEGMAVSPDGKTVVVGYVSPLASIDSFSVGSDGTLTEHGPLAGPFVLPLGVDITADGRYALLGEVPFGAANFLQIGIYTISSDGSLVSFNTFSNLGTLAINANFLSLSPDERFLYVSGYGGPLTAVTTLNFDESVPQVTTIGCYVQSKRSYGGLATAASTGSGELLYQGVVGAGNMASVAVYRVNASTGCPTEVPGSPFSSGEKGYGASLAAWPPRPF